MSRDIRAGNADQLVLDAAKRCCERWGIAKTTIDDIVGESGVSRATIYRLFPGGKEVLLDALRQREQVEFFGRLSEAVAGSTTLEDRLVTAVVVSTLELRADDHLAAMMANSPGEFAGRLTVDGLPRIIDNATAAFVPMLAPYLPADTAIRVVDVLVRLTLSYFLAPSELVDLGDERSARPFLQPIIAVLAPSYS